MSVEDSQELISAASRGTAPIPNDWIAARVDLVNSFVGFSELERPTGALHAHNVQVNGGNLTFVNGNVHNYNHINDAPKPEAPKVDLMAALESIDNHRRIQQDTLSKATPETGEWIFEYEKFPAWWDPQGEVKAIWGSGIPGAGKTVLTSIIINGIEKRAKEIAEDICIGYVYIRYSDNTGLTIRHYLEILVKQTVEKHPSCHKLAEGVYAEHIRLKTRPTEEELLNLLRTFAAMVKAFYFLDALDEAPQDIQIALVEKLLSTSAKLFITSRPSKALEERFPKAHHFSIAAQESDLDIHINSKLDCSQELSKVLEQGGVTFRAEIVASIKQNCGGMFLHASLQLAALQHCTTVHDVRETLADFPPKIEDVYRDTWTRIVDQASQKGARAQNCIIWVLNAPKSMTVEELQHVAAICLETHEFDRDRLVHVDTLVGLCRGLLVIDEKTALVRLVHYTAKETLASLILETFPHLHSLMASLCMGRLIQHGFQCWTRDNRTHTFNRVIEADPLLSYAYHTWATHARNSLNYPSTAAQVKGFVRGCRSFPVEHHRFTGYTGLELLGPLHVAAFYNLPISLAGSHLINTLDPNRRTKRNFTPLHLACMHTPHFNTVQELLSLRLINVNAVDTWGWTPLICAVESGNIGSVKLLLTHPKIRLDLTDASGSTAFTRAAWNGNEALVKVMLAHSPNEVHSTDGNGQTALSAACEGGNIGLVKLLLSHSHHEVRLVDNKGRTPLSQAAASHCVDTFKLILGHAKDDVHLKDKNGRTPLSWASQSSREEIIQILLAYPETDINQVDNDGRTPLSLASVHHSGVSVKVLLSNHRADVNLADRRGQTPLIWATRSRAEDSMKALLAHPQTNPNLPDNQGLTPLAYSFDSNPFPDSTPTVLLDHPTVDVNLPDNKGQAPLHRAVSCWSRDIDHIKQLLARPDVNVNAQDEGGRTPLIKVAMQKRIPYHNGDHECHDDHGHHTEEIHYHHCFEAITQALLAHPQIEVNLADNTGKTALSWASRQGHKNIVKLLLDHPQIQSEVQAEPDRGFSQLLDSAVKRIQSLWSI